MHQGEIQQFDEPQAVYDRPANMFVAGFMGSPSMNFIPATLTDDRTAPAVTVALRWRRRGDAAAAPTRLRAGRPTARSCSACGPSICSATIAELKARKPALAALTAPVEVVEPTGAETIALLKLGERDIVGRFDPDGAPRLGEQLPLGVDMAHACLFDPVDANPDSASRRLTFATYPSLAGRVVFVSGGATGIGADIVARLRAQSRARRLRRSAARGGRGARARASPRDGDGAAVHSRPTSPTFPRLQAAIERTREKLGPIGVLVNNAANDQRHKVDDVSVEFWDHTQNVNLRHHFFAAQAVHPQMRELGGGSIINLSSIAWRFGAGGNAGLCGGQGRRRRPDARARPRLRAGQYPRQRDRARRRDDRAPARALVQDAGIGRRDGRSGRRSRATLLGEEIARAALFLAADDSRMITKQSLTVDAGLR